MFDLTDKILNYARLLGASYADVRVIIRETETLYTKNGKLEDYSLNKEEGYGVRVIVNNGDLLLFQTLIIKILKKLLKKLYQLLKHRAN